MQVRLEQRTPQSLKGHAANSKRHTQADVELIRASIQRFGFNDPIGILEDGTIVEGHGRLQAALAEGITMVPVLVLENFSERDADMYRIAHNKITLAGTFDFQALASEMRDLLGDDISFEAMGFNPTLGDQILTMFREDGSKGRAVKSKESELSFEIVWDNPDQKKRWDAFVKRAKAVAGENASVAEVLTAFIMQHPVVPEARREIVRHG